MECQGSWSTNFWEFTWAPKLSTGALGLYAHANKSGFTWVLGVKLRFPIMHWSTLSLNLLPNTSLFLHVGHKLLTLSPLNFLFIITFRVSIKDLFIHVMNMSKLLVSSETAEVGHRWFLCSMWLLGIGLRTSVRAASILSCWNISSAPWFCLWGWVSECNHHCLRNCYIGQVVPNDKCHYQTKIMWEVHPCDLCFTLLL